MEARAEAWHVRRAVEKLEAARILAMEPAEYEAHRRLDGARNDWRRVKLLASNVMPAPARRRPVNVYYMKQPPTRCAEQLVREYCCAQVLVLANDFGISAWVSRQQECTLPPWLQIFDGSELRGGIDKLACWLRRRGLVGIVVGEPG